MGAGHNGGGNPKALTEQDIDKVKLALEQTGGIKTAAAQKLGIGRSTLYRFMDEFPLLKDFAVEIEEQTLDLAEGQTLKAIKEGDMSTVRWFLDRKAKHRGYGAVNVDLGNQRGQSFAVHHTIPAEALAKMSTESLRELQACLAAAAGDDGE